MYAQNTDFEHFNYMLIYHVILLEKYILNGYISWNVAKSHLLDINITFGCNQASSRFRNQN